MSACSGLLSGILLNNQLIYRLFLFQFVKTKCTDWLVTSWIWTSHKHFTASGHLRQMGKVPVSINKKYTANNLTCASSTQSLCENVIHNRIQIMQTTPFSSQSLSILANEMNTHKRGNHRNSAASAKEVWNHDQKQANPPVLSFAGSGSTVGSWCRPASRQIELVLHQCCTDLEGFHGNVHMLGSLPLCQWL